jgi:hypothetical protein
MKAEGIAILMLFTLAAILATVGCAAQPPVGSDCLYIPGAAYMTATPSHIDASGKCAPPQPGLPSK